MRKICKGFMLNVDALTGFTKKQFCEEFKSANELLAPRSIEDVWDEIKGDIPKPPRKSKKVEPEKESED